ncbi:phosphomannomutase [Salmonella enterica subsp. diarizonae]|uniref:Phosphomannomutase n=1 Tax=Salmonella diarizonae TaxID=59204 RepID=A0A379TZS6_SALDZ|nr:phosphomannomutase [Salmonella enterica subsp. diarizonae]
MPERTVAGRAGGGPDGGVPGERGNQQQAGGAGGSHCAVEAHFAEEAQAVDRTDGLSMSFPDWRFNLRSSNTEPVVRLNVESRGDIPLMEARTKEILQLLNS